MPINQKYSGFDLRKKNFGNPRIVLDNISVSIPSQTRSCLGPI
jgi:hypothetical protein